jgi:hypothetical protein
MRKIIAELAFAAIIIPHGVTPQRQSPASRRSSSCSLLASPPWTTRYFLS